MATFKGTTADVVCKYSFLVLIFSLFSTLQVGFLEPILKKGLKIGDQEDHEIKKEDILVKGIIFFIGMFILFVVFKGRLIKCATGV